LTVSDNHVAAIHTRHLEDQALVFHFGCIHDAAVAGRSVRYQQRHISELIVDQMAGSEHLERPGRGKTIIFVPKHQGSILKISL